MMQVTFHEIARVLETSGSQVVAAEGHGCLCGALCTTPDYTYERWLDELVAIDGESAAERPADDAFKLLFADTLRALRGDEMAFEPLLPDDDEPLERRATALAQWCQGFLYGFGTGRPIPEKDINDQVDEILKDFTHIARASVDVGAASEEEEDSYAQVVEYVRVGVQLVHDELISVRDAAVASEDSEADEPLDRDDMDFDAHDDHTH